MGSVFVYFAPKNGQIYPNLDPPGPFFQDLDHFRSIVAVFGPKIHVATRELPELTCCSLAGLFVVFLPVSVFTLCDLGPSRPRFGQIRIFLTRF